MSIPKENVDAAKLAVTLCNLVSDFNPVKNISKIAPEWNVTWSGGEPSDPNYCMLVYLNGTDTYGLVFRGSVMEKGVFTKWDEISDWVLEDLNDEMVYWPYHYGVLKFDIADMPCVGAGSLIALTNILKMVDKPTRAPLLTALTSLQNMGFKLIITGHSLGGNLAKVYTSYLFRALPQLAQEKVRLCTFAAPASGNQAFMDDLNKKIGGNQVHYQNKYDIVPGFPTAEGIAAAGLLYNPSPAADKIIAVDGTDITLKAVLMDLGNKFGKLGYKEPNKEYIQQFPEVLDPKWLDSKNIGDDFGSWKGQVEYQHQLFNYAGYLGVTLNPIQQPSQVSMPLEMN
ncbi:hypothetical protein [Chitinophaga sp. Cy-1792]|uniref:lipase family protein n=1 Tax=Chitinophaga sp. Cy-1792 TaxID=2608339 RepID=UPI0014236500|nr:hypothetical protein [Chitinophaga sp. Cy-1792]NIG55047.1 hypothetical protein [Chitinophaga sp. Cy-1792]